jgi:hypothetical protein
MSKAAKIVAAVVLTVAAVVTLNPQLMQAAIAMDLSVASDLLAKKPKATSAGSETSWNQDPRAGVPYLVGRCASAGDMVFQRSAPAAASNKYKNFATVYTVGPIDAYEGFYANDTLVPFTADSGEGASGYYLNRMWLKRQLGAAGEPYLHWTATGSKDTPANHGGLPPEWTSQHTLPGYAASLWALEFDTGKYSGGIPQPKMVARWVKVYDPRKDSTYPGGAGGQRYADPSNKAAYLAAQATWTWSANPYLHALMWCLGRWTGDPSLPDLPLVRTHGPGVPIAKVEVSQFVEGANVADANSWTLGGKVTSTDDKWEVLKTFLETGAGEPILMGAKIGCMVNTPKVSLATLTKADVIGDAQIAGAVAIENRLNTLWPSYTEEALNWEVVPFDQPVQVAAYLGPDRGERSDEMALPMVQSAVQAAQLARYRIEDSRELNPIMLPAKPKHMWLKPGDCITADEPEWGLNGQKLLIRRRLRDPMTMKVTFICRTETDGKHPFALGQTSSPPDTPALTGIDPNYVAAPAGDAWEVVGGVVAGASGSLPAIVISGEAELYEAVTIVVDYREVLPTLPVTYGEWASASFPAKSKTLVVQGVKAGAKYQVRVRYITARGAENPDANTDLGEIVVGGVGAGSLAGRPGQEIIDDLDQASLNNAATDLRNQVWRAQKEELINGIASLVDQLGIKSEEHEVYITFLREVDGVTGAAKVVLSTNVDGHITGTVQTNDGTEGEFAVVDDVFSVVAATGAPIKVFTVNTVTGKVEFRADVTINGNLIVIGSISTPQLAPQSVNVPVITVGSSTINCDGTNKLITSHTVTLDEDAPVFVTCFLSTHFPGGDKPWNADLYIDGVSMFPIGGANGEATMTLGGSKYCSAGDVLVEVRLNSHSSVNVTARTLSSLGPMR